MTILLVVNCRPLRAAVLLNERLYTGVIFWEAIWNLSHIAKVRFLIQIFGSTTSAEQLNNWEIGTTSFSVLSCKQTKNNWILQPNLQTQQAFQNNFKSNFFYNLLFEQWQYTEHAF